MLPADPIIDVEDILKTCGDPDFALTATSSSTGGYTFYSSDPSVVSVDGSGTATINSSGITIINIVQSAGVNYNSSSTSFTITVNKLNTDIIISDEIVKLNQLLKDGVLTKEEFEKAKKKILEE